MKKLVLMIAMVVFCGCAGIMSTTPGQSSAVISAQTAAEDSLYAIGTALQATPGIVQALYNASKINKDTYNAIASTYNQAIASYKLATNALQTAVTAGQDPSQVTAYTTALLTFMGDKNNVDNLLAAYGQKPVGSGVTK